MPSLRQRAKLILEPVAANRHPLPGGTAYLRKHFFIQRFPQPFTVSLGTLLWSVTQAKIHVVIDDK